MVGLVLSPFAAFLIWSQVEGARLNRVLDALEASREPLDVDFGLFEVFLKPRLEVVMRSGLGHFWQGFYELSFGAVEVFEFLVEEVCECFEFHNV